MQLEILYFCGKNSGLLDFTAATLAKLDAFQIILFLEGIHDF